MEFEKINEALRELNEVKNKFEFVDLTDDTNDLELDVVLLVDDVNELKDACQDVLDAIEYEVGE